MESLKRWIPLVGTLVLATSEVLKAFGQAEAADAVTSLGRGFVDSSTVGGAAIGAAIAALVGVGLKVKSEVGKAIQI